MRLGIQSMLCLILALCFCCRALRLAEVPEKAKLVFDIGMNRGDDTKRYLEMGYTVVSIEANPTWAKKGSELFKEEIKNGRLIIKNIAISNGTDEPVTFYVPKFKPGALSMVKWLDARGLLHDNLFSKSKVANESSGWGAMLEHADELSSMSKPACLKYSGACLKWSEKLNSTSKPMCLKWSAWDAAAAWDCEGVSVKSATCADLIKQYGTPYYLKVDIEGFDGNCMRSLATLPCSKMPSYISFEEQSIHHEIDASSEELIKILSARGYTWKTSRQQVKEHFELGAGSFGEDVEDYVHGKTWSLGAEALKQANLDCWGSISALSPAFMCDVHGKFHMSRCSEPTK